LSLFPKFSQEQRSRKNCKISEHVKGYLTNFTVYHIKVVFNTDNLLIAGGGIGGPDFIPTRTTKWLGSHVQILRKDDEHTSW